MCGAPANAEGWRDPGLLHSAVLSNLRPGTHISSMARHTHTPHTRQPHTRHMRAHAVRDADTRYYYVYGDPTFGFSAEASFVSEPHPGQSDRVIHLFAFGDMGKTTQVQNSIMTHTTHDTRHATRDTRHATHDTRHTTHTPRTKSTTY